MYMDLDLTKSKYNTLRSYNEKLLGHKNYPPYPKVSSAKTRCYPEDIHVTDNGANIELQSLLDHTIRRLIYSIAPEILGSLQDKSLILHSKWGMDGASSQQVLQQKRVKNTNKETSSKAVNTAEDASTSNEIDEHSNRSDHSVFIISFVPLELRLNHEIIWINDRPSSIRFCRPIKFEFVAESAINTLNEYNYYTQKINNLLPTYVVVDNNISFSVIHDLQCTMIDGKTCNIISNQKSSNSCNICGAKPTQMSKLEIISTLPRKTEFYKLGLCRLYTAKSVLWNAYSILLIIWILSKAVPEATKINVPNKIKRNSFKIL